jgi:hypothetical protein
VSDRYGSFIRLAVAIATADALLIGAASAADAPAAKMGAAMTAHCWTANVAYHAINTKGMGVIGRTAAPQSIVATVCPADARRNGVNYVTAADANGDFGVLPKGRYALSLKLEKVAATSAPLAAVTVTIRGGDAPTSMIWDFTSNSAKRGAGPGDLDGDGRILFTSNGRMHSDITISK